MRRLASVLGAHMVTADEAPKLLKEELLQRAVRFGFAPPSRLSRTCPPLLRFHLTSHITRACPLRRALQYSFKVGKPSTVANVINIENSTSQKVPAKKVQNGC